MDPNTNETQPVVVMDSLSGITYGPFSSGKEAEGWIEKQGGDEYTVWPLRPATTTQQPSAYPEHNNDLGDWCPYSGEPVQGTDSRCPQGCRDSAIDDDEDED